METKTEHNIRLTSSEIGNLWSTYMTDSMSVCVLKYFIAKTQDTEILAVLEFALGVSQTHIKEITEIYNQEGHPIPVGFGEQDVDLNAPALYSDTYFLNYVHNMSKLAMTTYSLSVSSVARRDIYEFFSKAYISAKDLYEKSLECLLSKGLYSRAAPIPIPEKVEFIQKQSYLTGWLGNRRPMNALEITQLYYNIQRNGIGKALLLGFSQVARKQKVRDYFVRGIDIAFKNIHDLGHKLAEENINVSPTWDSDVLNSTTPPFSDKLMMFHVSAISGLSIGVYGTALGTVARRDLGNLFMKILTEAIAYAEDGANLMIENEWLEEAPHAVHNISIAKRSEYS
ncbi:DUF3231 family protein [Ammoniphilus sp. 3BR4]|uniref:DUF3231 family protein n=1 Tax=Ammoniphilus sp. 3BR4 TaxID=3158265 RepID=UPI0034664B58